MGISHTEVASSADGQHARADRQAPYSGTGWIVATVFHTERAEAHLLNQGFETYVPRYTELVAVRGVLLNRTQRLFPGYLFVRMTPAWHAVLGTRGVRSVLMCAGAPDIMPERSYLLLRSREGNDGLIALDPISAEFDAGDRVRVVGGMMHNRIGVYQGMDAAARHVVLFKLLGRTVAKAVGTQESLIAA